MEIDFLIAKSKLARKNNIHAIEVKSGKNTTHRSLDKFSAKYFDWLDTPYLLWDRDLLIKDGILHLPLYMARGFRAELFRRAVLRGDGRGGHGA